MMKRKTIAIADFYVPVRRRQILDPQESVQSSSSGSPMMAYRSVWHLSVCCPEIATGPESLILHS